MPAFFIFLIFREYQQSTYLSPVLVFLVAINSKPWKKLWQIRSFCLSREEKEHTLKFFWQETKTRRTLVIISCRFVSPFYFRFLDITMVYSVTRKWNTNKIHYRRFLFFYVCLLCCLCLSSGDLKVLIVMNSSFASLNNPLLPELLVCVLWLDTAFTVTRTNNLSSK